MIVDDWMIMKWVNSKKNKNNNNNNVHDQEMQNAVKMQNCVS